MLLAAPVRTPNATTATLPTRALSNYYPYGGHSRHGQAAIYFEVYFHASAAMFVGLHLLDIGAALASHYDTHTVSYVTYRHYPSKSVLASTANVAVATRDNCLGTQTTASLHYCNELGGEVQRLHVRKRMQFYRPALHPVRDQL